MSTLEELMFEAQWEQATDALTHACAGPECQVCRMDAASRPEPREGRARHTDPATSHDGAASVTVQAGSQKARLLAAYRDAPGGLTDDQAAVRAGVTNGCFWKRCSEMRDDGLITDAGITRLGPLHGEARMVCVITTAGLGVLA